MFKIVKGGLEEKQKQLENKRSKEKELYKKMFYNAKDVYISAFWGVRYLGKFGMEDLREKRDLGYDDYLKNLQELFADTMSVDFVLSRMTLKNFINFFPIDKEYNGEKFMSKDYWSTLEMLKTLDAYESKLMIGPEIDDLLMDYWNRDIMRYSIYKMMLLSEMNKLQTGKNLLEQYIEDNNIEDIETVKKLDDKHYISSDGKILKESVNIPKYLKLIKNKKGANFEK